MNIRINLCYQDTFAFSCPCCLDETQHCVFNVFSQKCCWGGINVFCFGIHSKLQCCNNPWFFLFYSSHLSNKIFYQNLDLLKMFPHHLSLFICRDGIPVLSDSLCRFIFLPTHLLLQDILSPFHWLLRPLHFPTKRKKKDQQRMFSLTSTETNSSFYFPTRYLPDNILVTTQSISNQSADDFNF